MPRFWFKRRRSDGPLREWNGSKPSDPDQARRQLEQAHSIIEQTIHLHPKAEAIIHACRQDDAKMGLLGAESGEVRERYRRLREELRLLELPSWLAGELASILDHHLQLVSLALDLSYRPQTSGSGCSGIGCMGLGLRLTTRWTCATGSPSSLASDGGQREIGKETRMATVSGDEFLLLWHALSAFRSGASPACRLLDLRGPETRRISRYHAARDGAPVTAGVDG
jgi:hypothetical protein